MSINRGGAQPPVPNNGNIHGNGAGAPPPQAPVPGPAANTPALHAQTPAATPLPAPVGSTSHEVSSDPQLSPRQLFSMKMKSLREGWATVEEKLRCGDIASVHQMLDQGLVPCMVDGDEENYAVFTAFPRFIFQNLRDIDLFDRFVDLFVQHGLQSDLYSLVIGAGNGILLKRLVQGGVPGWKQVSEVLPDLIKQALAKSDPVQLEAFIRLWKEHCPTVHFEWNLIWNKGCVIGHTITDIDVLKVLVREIQPGRFGDFQLVCMLKVAVKVGSDEAVACLCGWLGDRLYELSWSGDWIEAQNDLSIEQLTLLARGGFPLSANALPPPDKEKAQEFQLVLFGPKLANGPFAKTLKVAKDYPAPKLVDFVFLCAFGEERGAQHGRRPPPYGTDDIVWSLFQNGLTAQLSIKLGSALEKYQRTGAQAVFRRGLDLGFLACLNECLSPDTLDPLMDPLSIEQAQAIHQATLAAVEETFGTPAGFFAAAISCIGRDGALDSERLIRIYCQFIGLSDEMVIKLAGVVKSACADVGASKMPSNLFQPGMTGDQFILAYQQWFQRSVARLLVTRLPQALGRSAGWQDWRGALGASAGVAAMDFVASANYLARSVIKQYAEILATDLDANCAAIVEACSSWPADAFAQKTRLYSEESSQSSSASDSESREEEDSQ